MCHPGKETEILWKPLFCKHCLKFLQETLEMKSPHWGCSVINEIQVERNLLCLNLFKNKICWDASILICNKSGVCHFWSNIHITKDGEISYSQISLETQYKEARLYSSPSICPFHIVKHFIQKIKIQKRWTMEAEQSWQNLGYNIELCNFTFSQKQYTIGLRL